MELEDYLLKKFQLNVGKKHDQIKKYFHYHQLKIICYSIMKQQVQVLRHRV